MKQKRWTFTRLFGMFAILALGAVQQPTTAMAAEMQPCWGVPGCWVCFAGDGEGGICIVRYCHGNIDYTCL
jgi:hypothetical protein